MLEICLLIKKLDKSVPKCSSIYKYPKLNNIEKSINVLSELKQFDMISYILYCKEIFKNDEIKANTCIETLHSKYNNKTIAKYEFKGVDRINIRLDFDVR